MAGPQAATRNEPGLDLNTTDCFAAVLKRHGLQLRRGHTATLQINVGYLCNQVCKHCHLECGPDRSEIMRPETMKDVIAYAERCSFDVADITGGAPEMNPHILDLLEGLAPLVHKLVFRSNLTAIPRIGKEKLFAAFVEHRVAIVASLPALNTSQVTAQRGEGVLDRSIERLKELNSLGYGKEGAGLELNLVSNPSGAFMPVSQKQAEKKFKRDLDRKWGIVFNNLFTFANAPLGRYRDWLVASGNCDRYVTELAKNFNPCAVEGVMCRSLISVSWDGYVYDCDFNLAAGIPAGGVRAHVRDLLKPPDPGSIISVSDHCFACTAGAGFT